VISCLCALALAAVASPAHAEEPTDLPSPAEPAPGPDLPPPSARLNLALTGVAMTGGFYGAALASSFIWSNGKWAPDVRIPVAGPWLALRHLECGSGELNCGTALVIVRGVLAGLDGVGQAGGLLVALESLFLPTRAATHAHAPRTTKHAWVRPVPFLDGDSVGLGIVGEM
jgi:hypothetical protein